jgi:long-subunit fatty acid transport protein
MLGVTIGIPVINMHNDMYYQESLAGGNTQPNPYGFRSFNYTQTLDINGAGVNAKIGAIYKLTDHFRIGAAFHSPTWYSITDVSNPGITTARRSGGIDSTAVLTVENQSLLQNQFDYNLTTPWKGVLSATLIIDHFGFISADYEYVDYASMRYAFPSGVDPISGAPLQSQADAMNQEIRKIYQGTSNFRLGAEWKANSIVMVRGGFGYYGNAFTPYGQMANSAAYTSDRIDLSLGAGFRFKRFFTDIALVHGMYTVNSKPYTIDYSGVVSTVPNQAIPTAKTDYSTNNVALTLGMKLGEHTAERRHHRRY